MTRYIEAHRERFGVEPICRTLQFAPSSYYAARQRPPSARRQRDEALKLELQQAHADQTIVLVSHSIVMRVMVLAALGLGLDHLWTVDAAPAGITEIEYEPDWATVHRMNTVSHLDGVAS